MFLIITILLGGLMVNLKNNLPQRSDNSGHTATACALAQIRHYDWTSHIPRTLNDIFPISLLTFFILYTGAFPVMIVNPMPIME